MTNLFKIWIGIVMLGGILIAINAYELKADADDQLIENLIYVHQLESQIKTPKLYSASNCYQNDLLKEKCQHYYCEQLRYNIKRKQQNFDPTFITP